MAKIAVELERALALRRLNGSTGQMSARVLASGDGWSVTDMVCTSGPEDRPFEEQNANFTIAIVGAGSFQYRASCNQASAGGELMSPGSLLLGNAGQWFECGHEHGFGDHCLSFQYSPECFERLAADFGAPRSKRNFRVLRLPPLRALAPLTARVCAGVTAPPNISWEEVSVELAAKAMQLANDCSVTANELQPAALARVTRAIRMIENGIDAVTDLGLGSLARAAGLSPYHFLRTLQHLIGVTPHQYILRTRLRKAAMRLATKEPAKILDIALDSGFEDVSNFNHAFRAEFGVSPRGFRGKHATVHEMASGLGGDLSAEY